MKKLKKHIIIALAVLSLGISTAFIDSYFEVSKNLDIFINLFKEVNIRYVDPTKPGELMKTAIDGMLKSLDPYTVYIPESKIEDYRFMTTGQYGGIGSLISKRGNHIIVSEPYEGYPAQKAGLLAGDIIMEINGVSAEGKSTEEISSMLKGEPGTSLTVKVKRGNEIKEITLTREKIKIDDVPYFGKIDEETGYVKLTSFTETAASQVKDAFKKMKEQGIKKIIFDLRDNGGGLLNQAIEIVNIFVEKGQEVVRTKGKQSQWDKVYYTKNMPLDTEMPLVVLINENSASASEIVSGTMQDLDRGVLVGRKSYGKGLVQQTIPLSYNAQLKITVAKYYTPSGRCIQKLDYSHKDESGRATEIPDSLIQIFYTKNGREVRDGEGITPDIEVTPEESHEILLVLMSNYKIFDFATKYRLEHDSIPAPEEFHLTDAEYEQFVDFVYSDDSLQYEIESERILEDLEKVLELEQFEGLEKDIEAIKSKIDSLKRQDIYRYRKEVQEVLENEIVSRYYYQKGRIRHALTNDPDISQSLQILHDTSLYNNILTGKYPPKEEDKK
jgi:carboxyl-terminal processing protease